MVKPAQRGSSVGVAIVQTLNALTFALETAFKHDNTVLVEEYLKGQELTCGVLEIKDGKYLSLSACSLCW